jgi:hypothetical protein
VADMPDTRASRKQQISDGPISSCLFSSWRRVLPFGP